VGSGEWGVGWKNFYPIFICTVHGGVAPFSIDGGFLITVGWALPAKN
jgi:hypothetical protein